MGAGSAEESFALRGGEEFGDAGEVAEAEGGEPPGMVRG